MVLPVMPGREKVAWRGQERVEMCRDMVVVLLLGGGRGERQSCWRYTFLPPATEPWQRSSNKQSLPRSLRQTEVQEEEETRKRHMLFRVIAAAQWHTW